MKVLRWVLFLVLGLITVGFLVRTVLHVRKTDPGKIKILASPMAVEVDNVKVRTLSETVGASCSVAQVSTVVLKTRLDSKVQAVNVEIGDLVAEKDPLIHWDTRGNEAALASYRSDLASAETSIQASTDQIARLTTLMEKGLGAALELDDERVALAQAQAERSAALSSIAAEEILLEESPMLAPIAGVILSRTVNPGEITQKDQEVLQIGALDKVFAVAQVSEERSGAVALGQEAKVSFEAFPSETYKGKVVRIDPNVDAETRSFSAFILIENPRLQLKPGQTGFARIFRSKETLAVIAEAVMKPFTDAATVFVLDENDVARLREVKIGMTIGGYTEILSGLEEHDRVVVAGQLKLQSGDKVNIVERDKP